MPVYAEEFTVATEVPIKIVNVTENVRQIVRRAGIKAGVVSVSTQHTTAAIRINENCPNLVQDLAAFFEQLVPQNGGYQHDIHTIDDRPNARSHLLAVLMGASETVPVRDGRVELGQWQSIFFVELDGPRPKRTVTVTVIGG